MSDSSINTVTPEPELSERDLARFNAKIEPRQSLGIAQITEEIFFERKNGATGDVRQNTFKHAMNPGCRPTNLKATIINGSCSDKDKKEKIVAEMTTEIREFEEAKKIKMDAMRDHDPVVYGICPGYRGFVFSLGELKKEHSVIITLSYQVKMEQNENNENEIKLEENETCFDVRLPVSLTYRNVTNPNAGEVQAIVAESSTDDNVENWSAVEVIGGKTLAKVFHSNKELRVRNQNLQTESGRIFEGKISPVQSEVKLQLIYEETPTQCVDHCMFKLSGLPDVSEGVTHPLNGKIGVILYHPESHVTSTWSGLVGLQEVNINPGLVGDENDIFAKLFDGQTADGFSGFIFDRKPDYVHLELRNASSQDEILNKTLSLEMGTLKNPLFWSFIQSEISRREKDLTTDELKQELIALSCMTSVICSLTAFIGVKKIKKEPRPENDNNVGGRLATDNNDSAHEGWVKKLIFPEEFNNLLKGLPIHTDAIADNITSQTNHERYSRPRPRRGPSGAAGAAVPPKAPKIPDSPTINWVKFLFDAGSVVGKISYEKFVQKTEVKDLSTICSIDLFDLQKKTELWQFSSEIVSEESRKLLEENNDFLTTLLFLVLMTVTSDDCDERISKYARKPEKWFKIKSKISDAQLKELIDAFKKKYFQ